MYVIGSRHTLQTSLNLVTLSQQQVTWAVRILTFTTNSQVWSGGFVHKIYYLKREEAYSGAAKWAMKLWIMYGA